MEVVEGSLQDVLTYSDTLLVLDEKAADWSGYGDRWLNKILDGTADPVKWYAHDECMLWLSLQLPDVVFMLAGEGEESGDWWRTYYQNGKLATYRPEMKWPVFKKEDLHVEKKSK